MSKKYMRKLIFILLPLLLACENRVKPDVNLVNNWQWLSSSGGFAGQILTPASTGDEVSIEFTSKKFRRYKNGSQVEDLRYSVKLEKSIFSTEDVEVINYSNDWRQTYRIAGDTLYLSDECYDCFFHTYIKVKGD